jgi:HSP20 family molecular chaperone IbpA
MWARAVEMLDEAERLHRRFFHLAGQGAAVATWEPPVDVFDDGREVVIVVAMPGVHADAVEVRRDGGTLVVRGTRPLPRTRTGHRILQLEIPHGAFERRIALPPGSFELAAPELAEGCLWLRLTRHTTVR